MINGAHAIIYSKNSDADRKFLKDVLKLTHVDVGGGWLIFGLPPSEVAIHPSGGSESHELYLMCEDIEAFVATMSKKNLACTAVKNLGWGLLSTVTLPGGGKLGVYEPRHARPEPMGGATTPKKAKRSAKKLAKEPAKNASKKTVKRSR